MKHDKQPLQNGSKRANEMTVGSAQQAAEISRQSSRSTITELLSIALKSAPLLIVILVGVLFFQRTIDPAWTLPALAIELGMFAIFLFVVIPRKSHKQHSRG
jgi:membrane protein YdbS with pleckstrin-like domain